MTRQQRIVLSSVLLVMFPVTVLAECRNSDTLDPFLATTNSAILIPDHSADCVMVNPNRTMERTSMTHRPVMLLAGVGIALGLLIRTVKVRSL